DLEVLPNGKVVLAGTPFLAGSWHFTDACVGNVVRFAGVGLKDAVEMATVRPRQLLGLPVNTIAVGQPADLVVFDWEPGGELRVPAERPAWAGWSVIPRREADSPVRRGHVVSEIQGFSSFAACPVRSVCTPCAEFPVISLPTAKETRTAGPAARRAPGRPRQ